MEYLVGVIGIDLNINLRQSACDGMQVTSMRAASGRPFNKQHVFEVLIAMLEYNLELWLTKGFSKIASDLNESIDFTNEIVIRLQDKESGIVTAGKLLRIDEEGKLWLELEDGSQKAFLDHTLLRELGIDY